MTRRISLSRDALLGLTALYLATVLNAAFYRAAMQATAVLDPYPWVFMISLPFFLFFVLLFVLNLVYLPYIGRTLVALLILISAAAGYASFTYGILFDYDMMQNIAQTHYGEAASYLNGVQIILILVVQLPHLMIY